LPEKEGDEPERVLYHVRLSGSAVIANSAHARVDRLYGGVFGGPDIVRRAVKVESRPVSQNMVMKRYCGRRVSWGSPAPARSAQLVGVPRPRAGLIPKRSFFSR